MLKESYENLANAIILQAVKDYRIARKRAKHRPVKKEVKDMTQKCETFFLSGWFEMLTSIDGGMLLTKLQEEEIS